MLARLLYAAIGLCLLGTRPEHASTRPAPAVEAAAPARSAPAFETGAAAAATVDAAPPDFAIPRIQR